MINHPIKIYIAGKITGNKFYKLQFVRVMKWLKAIYPNAVVINPASLPQGLSNADYVRIYLSMIDSADIVVFQHNMGDSKGCMLKLDYCNYVDKPYAVLSTEFDENNYCPECDSTVKIGYACGEYFVIGSNTNCPCCDDFNLMRNSGADEVNCWEVYKAMYIAEKAKHAPVTAECKWVDDWLNYPFYKCCNCGNVFVGSVNYCQNCGRKITKESYFGGKLNDG